MDIERQKTISKAKIADSKGQFVTSHTDETTNVSIFYALNKSEIGEVLLSKIIKVGENPYEAIQLSFTYQEFKQLINKGALFLDENYEAE